MSGNQLIEGPSRKGGLDLPFSKKPTVLCPPNPNNPVAIIKDGNLFQIHVADSSKKQDQAIHLVRKMYGGRGYSHSKIILNSPHSMTLIIFGSNTEAVGTVTIRKDSSKGLLAEENYEREIGYFRTKGRKICEFTGLAMSPAIQSKKVLARLFHTAVIVSLGLFGNTDLVIEVTPAHARFYKRMLGFSLIGEEKVCPRVNTKGVLLHVDFRWVSEKINAVGGLLDKAEEDKTLYPYFFDKVEAEKILEKMRKTFSSKGESGVIPLYQVPKPNPFSTLAFGSLS